MQLYSLLPIVLMLFSLMAVCDANCIFPIGEKVPGEQLLHNITITKGPLAVEQIIQLELDYRVSPLRNEEITFVQLEGTGPGCSASISNSVNRIKQLLGTVTSVTQLKEFTVKLSVYGVLYE
ncbi:uncharacterized protein LOC126559461 [Anopheles maculipalpis]|uniref:uncharacterized protein LOC126559461 n=1 Tax=Anopheles maculipalpis TaxID=1496333 RepID=UPI002158AF51|nr:uncharacterized protein LOC126559461 [Anopheles maculipalpis]